MNVLINESFPNYFPSDLVPSSSGKRNGSLRHNRKKLEKEAVDLEAEAPSVHVHGVHLVQCVFFFQRFLTVNGSFGRPRLGGPTVGARGLRTWRTFPCMVPQLRDRDVS